MALNVLLISFVFISATHACNICSLSTLAEDTYEQKTYTSSDAIVINPERGFAVLKESFDDHGLGQEAPLTADMIDGILEEYGPISVIWRRWYLDTVSNIPPAYLALITADLDVLRQAGLKATIRFAYTIDQDTGGSTELAPQQIAGHIYELAALLAANEDVIMSVQIGFIGVWGEWYYSTGFGNEDVIDEAEWALRRHVAKVLMDVVPISRFLHVRTPDYKRALTQTNAALNDSDYKDPNNPAARIGYHNECFLFGATDNGTYSNVTVDYPFLEAETKYVPMGGKTCGLNAPRTDCTTAKEELAKFHWTYLDIDESDGVITSWKDGGCFDEITRKLGYRLRLTEASLPKTVISGSDACFKISFTNDGYAAPINQRDVKIILRDVAGNHTNYTSAHITAFTELEPWLPEYTAITVQFTLKLDVPVGAYDVLLELADPLLPDKPAYSIILLNQGVIEMETALNNLGHVITVTEATTAGVCAGFSEKNTTSSTAGTRCASSCSGLRFGVDEEPDPMPKPDNGAVPSCVSSVVFSCSLAILAWLFTEL